MLGIREFGCIRFPHEAGLSMFYPYISKLMILLHSSRFTRYSLVVQVAGTRPIKLSSGGCKPGISNESI
jgi:hypothetical protein